MASNNGRLSHRVMGGGKPSFLLLALCVIIVILLYSYWSLSSRNSLLLRDVTILQSRLRSLTGNKMKVDNKIKRLMSDLTRMQGDSSALKETVENQKKAKVAVDKKVAGLQRELEVKQQSLEKMQSVEAKYKKELQGFQENIRNTSKKFKQLNERASKVLKLYKDLRQKNSELQKNVTLLEGQVNKYKNAHKSVQTKEGKDKQTGGRVSKPLGRTTRVKKIGIAATLTQPDDSRVVTQPSRRRPSIEDDENEDGKDGEGSKNIEIVNPTGNNTSDHSQTTKAQGNKTKTSGSDTPALHLNSSTTIASTKNLSNVSSSNGSIVRPTLLTAAPSSNISKVNGGVFNKLKEQLRSIQGSPNPGKHQEILGKWSESPDNQIGVLPRPAGQPGSAGRQPGYRPNQEVPGRFGKIPKDNPQRRLPPNARKMNRPKSGEDEDADDEGEKGE